MAALTSAALSAMRSARPIVKWAGGKQQLLERLLPKVPKKFNRYFEPFFGGGALFFALAPSDAVVSDANPELINLYNVVASHSAALIRELEGMKSDEKSYYRVREQDASELSNVQRAARFIYLNRTCFNGLYRVNKKGEFNVPFGGYKNPRICDPPAIVAAAQVLSRAAIRCEDYARILTDEVCEGDFVYLDPPYLPISRYSDFKRYTKEQFREEDHRKLAQLVRMVHERGAHTIVSNSNHELVYELYRGFDIEVVRTRRNINSVGTGRATGEDVIINARPRRRLLVKAAPPGLSEQVARYPTTRFMGSKQNLVSEIWRAAAPFSPKVVLDLFSGSGVVSYMFKAQGARVISNDYMAFASTFAKAMVENNSVKLNAQDVAFLCTPKRKTDRFVARTFADLYFSDEDNDFIDTVRTNLRLLDCEFKRAVAMAALVRACMKKRARGIFTYTGYRYDDGRRDHKLSLLEQFQAAVAKINNAIFDNGRENKAMSVDAMDCRAMAELVYIDPPYFSRLSDNEYVRRYHFVEGLARDWQGVEIQANTKTRKFRSYPTPFRTELGAEDALERLFKRYRRSVLLVSYSSNSLPSKETITSLLARYKSHVEVVALDHRYSFGNQPHKVGNLNNKVKEYLFVGS